MPNTPVVTGEDVTLRVKRASETTWLFSVVDAVGLPVVGPIVPPAVANWNGEVTDEVQIMGETVNVLDRVAGSGSFSGRVTYSQMRYYPRQSAVAIPLEFDAEEIPYPIHNTLPDAYEWRLIAPDSFEFWDKRP